MRIKKIVYNNHNILGNLELDFTNKNGKAEDMIFIAGENGCGKTTIINNIFDMFSSVRVNGEGLLSYYLELNDEDVNFLKKNKPEWFSGFAQNELRIDRDANLEYEEIYIHGEKNKVYGSTIRIFGNI